MSTEIHIINNSHREITKERNSKKEWDNEESISTNEIKGFEIISPEDNWKTVDLTVFFDINPEKTYYLVSVIYSTGDSFNHHKGKIDYIELYEKYEMALATKKIIEKSYKSKDKEEKYSVSVLNNDGNLYSISTSA